jgi:hypothetical protein
MSKTLNVDLSDPRVRDMLGGPSSLASGKREVVQLAGDPANPTPAGLQSTTHLTGGKQEVVVVYGDLLMTLDVYALPGEPMRVQIICPRCRKHSTIRGDQKKIEYEPTSLNPRAALVKAMVGHSQAELDLVTAAQFGRLSIEPFECAWEIGDAPHVAGAVHTGASLCRLRLAIENNRAREV